MHAATLVVFAVIVALVFLSPGPTLSLLSSAAADRAPGAGLATLAGACGAIATYAAAGLLIVELALATSPAVFALLKTLGSCYLVWHGAIALYEAWAAPGAALAPPPSSEVPRGPGESLRYGWRTSLLNPKPALICVCALLQLVSIDTGSILVQGRLFASVLLVVAALCYGAVATDLLPMDRWLSRSRVIQVVLTATAAILVALGLQSLGVRSSSLL